MYWKESQSDVANFSAGSGDPISLAKLKSGESVLDLGSGGGLDCFVAARQVGESGRVIGVDMTVEMLARARVQSGGVESVECGIPRRLAGKPACSR